VSPVLVALHAHPDDEAIFTGGTIVRAVEAGWRVVLVVATDGGRGAAVRGGGSDLASHRRAETLDAAAELGVHRVEFLGYGDSGYDSPLRGIPTAGASARAVLPGTLAATNLDWPVAAVRRILNEEDATVLTSYDDNGIYGHIDHVRVHEIGRRSIVGTACELVEATLDRDALRQVRAQLVGRGLVSGLWPSSLTDQLGLEHGPTVAAVDVRGQRGRKMAAISAHASQVVEASTFMGLPAGAFHHLLTTEWFYVARPGRGRFLELLHRTGPTVPACLPALAQW
jgi:LmbE family N-acetylglucosaminyl deacetylase